MQAKTSQPWASSSRTDDSAAETTADTEVSARGVTAAEATAMRVVMTAKRMLSVGLVGLKDGEVESWKCWECWSG